MSNGGDPGNPPNFTFQPGQLFPLPPPGTLENIPFASLSLAFDIASGNVLGIIIDIATLLDDLIQGLISLFEGKPRELSTITVIQRLEHSANPAGYIAGVRFQRLLNDLGIVLSDSRPSSQADLGGIRKQAYAMLAAQGVTAARARTVIDSVINQTTSATQPLPAELKAPLPQGYTLNGPTSLLTLWATRYNEDIAKGWDPLQSEQDALHYMLAHGVRQDLGKITVIPPPPQPQPPPPPPPPPPPGGQPQPCWPTDQPDGDELTDAMSCIEQNTAILASTLPNLLSQLVNQGAGGATDGTGEGDSAQCCANIVAAIAALTAQLVDVTNLLTPSSTAPSAPIDLTPIATSLAKIASELTSYPQFWGKWNVILEKLLGNIATAISTAPGTDVSGIVAQLKTIAGQGDVDQAIFDALQQQGLLSGADLQALQGIKWSDALSYITSSAPVRAVENFISKAGTDAEIAADALKKGLAPVGNWAESKIIDALKLERNAIQVPLAAIISALASALKPAGTTQIGNIGVNPDTVLADCASVGFNLRVITALVGLFREGAAEELGRIVEIVMGFLGLEELREVQIGPLVQYGIARVAEMQARALFQQELPGAGELGSLAARGLLTPTRAGQLIPYTGTPGELAPAIMLAQYRGLNARQMLRLIETDLFTASDITDELTFSGMRQVSQARMLQAAPYLATASERSSLRAELQAAYVAGLYSDAQLTQAVQAAEQNTDLAGLVLQTAQLKKLIAETKALEAEYVTLYLAGLLDDATLRSDLAGIGLQPDMVNMVAGKAEARANATLQKQTLAAARALARTTAAEERKAAMKNFAGGNINAAELLAALVATGLTAIQAAAWVDLAQLSFAGSLRWVYGLQLTQPAAKLLTERVAALSDQLKRQLIKPAEFEAALAALKIPDKYINALEAAANALAAAGKLASLTPVSTS